MKARGGDTRPWARLQDGQGQVPIRGSWSLHSRAVLTPRVLPTSAGASVRTGPERG